MNCDQRFQEINGQCVHYLWPLDNISIFGSIAICFIAGVSSIAGLGGGGPTLVILLIAFNFTAKDSTIVVFVCILGATLGNTLTQMRKSLNGKPLIKYQYAFVSIPIMFTGSFVGVVINKTFPSIITFGFIITLSISSMKSILLKFKKSYKEQTSKNLLNQSSIYQQTLINPFNSRRYTYINCNLFFLVFIYILFQIIRGSQKFPSILNIQSCSFVYWYLCIVSITITASFAIFNYKILIIWINNQKQNNLGETNNQSIIQNKCNFIGASLLGGVFSGFGLGGGMFLVPLYRKMGLNPLQATSTCGFGVFLTALINCIQGICLGIITLSDFFFFFILTCLGGIILSNIICQHLKRINRLSIVELIFFLMLLFSLINIPISLWIKYQRSGYNSDTILRFSSFC